MHKFEQKSDSAANRVAMGALHDRTERRDCMRTPSANAITDAAAVANHT